MLKLCKNRKGAGEGKIWDVGYRTERPIIPLTTGLMLLSVIIIYAAAFLQIAQKGHPLCSLLVYSLRRAQAKLFSIKRWRSDNSDGFDNTICNNLHWAQKKTDSGYFRR